MNRAVGLWLVKLIVLCVQKSKFKMGHCEIQCCFYWPCGLLVEKGQCKRVGSERHQRGIWFESLYPCYPGEPQTAVITRSLIGAGASKKRLIVKLFVVAYTMAKLEIPWLIFSHCPNGSPLWSRLEQYSFAESKQGSPTSLGKLANMI